MITKFCIWWLRRKKVSVLIGYRATFGIIKQVNNAGFIYDNHFEKAVYLLPNGDKFDVPGGKFKINGY